ADSQIGWTWTELCETMGANAYLNRTTRALVQISPRIFTMKYIDRTALTKSQNLTNPIILRYADVLLVLAEAENHVHGPTGAAYAAINQVRTRSNVPDLTPGLTQGQLRDPVWLQRRHEPYGASQQQAGLKRVSRSGGEYACAQGWGIFDGPSDSASVSAIATWRANVVRLPLNETCWLGINRVTPSYAGANYQQAVADYVARLNGAGLVVILDLHWTAADTAKALGQAAMPNRDH